MKAEEDANGRTLGRRRAAGGRFLAALALAALVAGGCATNEGPPEPLPRHPFPLWVSLLEPGRTDVDEVLDRFGDPDEIEESVRGGTTWRYRVPEIHWADDDPMRPRVSADGSLVEPEPSPLAVPLAHLERFGRFLDRLLYYPGTQPRPPRRRAVDATIHLLEIGFSPDGTLRRHQYASEPGRVLVPVDS